MPSSPQASTRARIAVLPGDGIGPEVMSASIAVLENISNEDFQLEFNEPHKKR